jgi:hypothetical protein
MELRSLAKRKDDDGDEDKKQKQCKGGGHPNSQKLPTIFYFKISIIDVEEAVPNHRLAPLQPKMDPLWI